MRRGHEARLGRLWAAYTDAEEEAAGERSVLRFYADAHPLVQEAMLRAGIDPAASPAMREIEEKLAGFVDTPESERADAELEAAEREGKEPVLVDGEDPHEWLIAHVEEIGRRYAESGALPDFERASIWELLGWATQSDDAEDEAAGAAGEEVPP